MYFTGWTLLLTFQECIILYIKGMNGFTLTPPEVMYVCPGEPLILICGTNEHFLKWNISIPQYQYIGQRFVSPTGVSHIEPLSVNSLEFNFTRNSTKPLVVTLVINHVIVDLKVACNEYTRSGISSNVDVLATAVQVIKANDTSDLSPPDLRIVDQSFGKYNVTIFLERMMLVQEDSYDRIAYTATVTVVPCVPIIAHNATRYKFSLSYNVKYNVTAFATMCGQSSEMVTIEQFYARCKNLVRGTNIDASIITVNYTDPPLEGTIVNLSCPPELVLTGPDSATCMKDGKWEPDPTDVTCKAIRLTVDRTNAILLSYPVDCGVPITNTNISLSYNSTLENSPLLFWCRHGLIPNERFLAICHRNGNWSPTPTQHFCATASSASCSIPTTIINGHILAYTDTVEGAMITIICHDIQLVSPLIENSTTAICNHDGQWKPNPYDICIKIPEFDNPTSESTLSREVLIAIVSSIAVFLSSSILFFAIGLSCMKLCRSEKATTAATTSTAITATTTESNEPAPVYESLNFNTGHVGHQIQDLELKENIAYSSVHRQQK